MLIHVKPIAISPRVCARVRMPPPNARQLLPEEGRVVEDESFWRRREADGEVEVSAPDAPPAASPAIETQDPPPAHNRRAAKEA